MALETKSAHLTRILFKLAIVNDRQSPHSPSRPSRARVPSSYLRFVDFFVEASFFRGRACCSFTSAVLWTHLQCVPNGVRAYVFFFFNRQTLGYKFFFSSFTRPRARERDTVGGEVARTFAEQKPEGRVRAVLLRARFPPIDRQGRNIKTQSRVLCARTVSYVAAVARQKNPHDSGGGGSSAR